MSDWEVDAVRLAAVVNQLKKDGTYSQVVARCRPDVQALVGDVFQKRSHSGLQLLDFHQAIVDELGLEGFERVNHLGLKTSYSNIAQSLIAITVTLTGGSAGALLARLPETVSRVLRGLAITWKQSGPSRGVLTVEYPTEVPAFLEYAWRGMVRFLGDLARTPIRFDSAVMQDGRRFVFDLSW